MPVCTWLGTLDTILREFVPLVIGLEYSVLWNPPIIRDVHLGDGRPCCFEISAVVPYRASADLISTGRVTVMNLGFELSTRLSFALRQST